MNLEVLSATNFIVNLLRGSREEVGEDELGIFRKSLMEVLRQRVSKHWYPDEPLRGSGYRCIRVNGRVDPVIEKAGRMSGVDEEVLKQGLPGELTVWVDPGEVGYRFGENHGSYCVLWKRGEGDDEEPWTPSEQSTKNESRQSPTPSQNSRQSPVDLNSTRVVHNVDNSQFIHRSGHVECSIGYNVRNYRPEPKHQEQLQQPDIWLRNLTSRPPPNCFKSSDQVWNGLENPWNINSRQGSPARPKPWMSYKNMDFWTRDMAAQNQMNGRQYA